MTQTTSDTAGLTGSHRPTSVMTREEIAHVQQRLYDLGFADTSRSRRQWCDGLWGPASAGALKRLQTSYNRRTGRTIPVDGAYGPLTQQAIQWLTTHPARRRTASGLLWGVDVSHHQGAVDWDRVVRDGITFAICKATEGTDWVDPRVRVNLRGMRGAGLVPGVYHFLRESDTRAQVDNFVSTVRDFDGLLVVVDVEKAANGRFPSFAQVREFVRLLRRRTGDRPVIVYTGEWFWRGVLGNPDARELRALLWHSRYVGNAVPVGHPRTMHAGVVDSWWKPAYGGWSRATFLQFSSRARTAGVSPIDADVFRGGISELRRLAP